MRKLLLLLIIAGFGYWGWRQSGRISRTLDDGILTAQVLARIAREKPLALLSVKVSAHEGTVKLLGHVRTLKEQEELLNLAEQVKGVARVDNRLSLDRRLRTEDELKKDLELTAVIKKNLVREEGLRGLQIHVAVDQGNVLLTGEVPSQEQALLAQKIAYAVHGVRNVKSVIKVTGEVKHDLH